MPRVLVALVLALVLLAAAAGAAMAALRLAWEEVPAPEAEELAGPACGWAFCRSPPPENVTPFAKTRPKGGRTWD